MSLPDRRDLQTQLGLDVDGVYHVGEHYANTVGDTIAVRGQITQRSTTDPKLREGAWECHCCGNVNHVKQRYWSIQRPFL